MSAVLVGSPTGWFLPPVKLDNYNNNNNKLNIIFMQCNTWSGKSKQSRRKNITKSETRSQLLFETSLFHKNDLGPDMTGEHNSKVALK